MKKIKLLSIAMALTLMPASLSSCLLLMGDDDESSEAEKTSVSDNSSVSDSKISQKEETPEYEVKVTDYFLSKDYKDEEVLVVEYEWTNNSDEPKSFITVFDDKLYQNGVECDDSVVGCDDVNADDAWANIQPGTTFKVKCDYYIRDKSPINIVVTRWLGDDKYIDETIEF
jgi:hypothetical protein